MTLDDGTAEVAHEALIREWPRLRRLARRGPRRHPRAPPARRRRTPLGRGRPRDRRTCTAARGSPARSSSAQAGRAELNATERAFLDASVAESERERRAEQRANRRLRGLLAGGAVLLVVAIAGAVLSLLARSNARTAKSAAQAQALSSDAERVGALARTAPTLEQSLLFAVAGVELQDQRRDAREPARRAAAQPGGRPQAAPGGGVRSSRSRPVPTAACWRPGMARGGSASPIWERGSRAGRRSSSPSRSPRRR